MTTITSNEDRTIFGTLHNAMHESNQTIVYFLMHQEATSQTILKLKTVLQTCQNVVGSLVEGDYGTSPSSTTSVTALLDMCIKTPHDQSTVNHVTGNTGTGASTTGEGVDHSSALTDRFQHPPTQQQLIEIESRPLLSNDRLRGQRLKKNAMILDDASSGGFYVFDKPILIPGSIVNSTVLIDEVGVSEMCMFLTFVVTFNLALIHHLAARDTLSFTTNINDRMIKYRNLLKKAARIYEVCLTIKRNHTGHDEAIDQSYPADPSFFDLAVSNNLGIIFALLDDLVRSRECFNYTLNLILLFIHQQQDDQGDGFPGELQTCEHMNGIFGNVASVMYHTTVAPAA